MNDNFCHDANNLQECQWDGGDCCGNENENWDMFCEACECLDPLTCVWPEWAGDQKCDDVTNTRACDWDGGDCCYNNRRTLC